MKELKCLRCNTSMLYQGAKKIQMGETGWILGDLPNLLAGAMEIELYTCPQCGKLEFYQREYEESGLAQVQCPQCGQSHDCDYPKCPFCGHRYSN